MTPVCTGLDNQDATVRQGDQESGGAGEGVEGLAAGAGEGRGREEAGEGAGGREQAPDQHHRHLVWERQ